ncbi:hypothetical protein [Brevibacillus thermoruber]|uniref:Uncharacterized protein n=1 Tax=Brevibacillus thermoruber TaxID=33942 RepID=A0A9X3TVL2_9BACL|nr:hypothetical protein [Brevibacillus thermoruber]MDA5110873.1 hypothetical protein [Brevibacillus thermoruber]
MNGIKIQVQEVTDLDIVFGGWAMELLPPYNEIPEEFREGRKNGTSSFQHGFSAD